MYFQGRSLASVFVAGIWVNASEFLRNELVLKPMWLAHYRALGLVFPSTPGHAAVWVIWGFLFAAILHLLSRRFGLVATTFIAWLAGFVLMWLATWNLGVLPVGILFAAVPLSMLECLVGAYLCTRIAPLPETL